MGGGVGRDGDQEVYRNAILAAQFFCEPKISLKNSLLILKRWKILRHFIVRNIGSHSHLSIEALCRVAVVPLKNLCLLGNTMICCITIKTQKSVSHISASHPCYG